MIEERGSVFSKKKGIRLFVALAGVAVTTGVMMGCGREEELSAMSVEEGYDAG